MLRLPPLNLQTRLILMMALLSSAIMLAMSILYSQSEKRLVAEVHGHTAELVKAIEVSVERLTTQGVTDEMRLGEYINRINKRGIEEISIISKDDEIIASSNPDQIGSRISRKRKDLIIRATIGAEEEPSEGQKAYNLIVPVVVGKEQIGYIHLIMRLDDFREVIRANLKTRLLMTALIFLVGILASVYMARRYMVPIDRVVAAAEGVASGNLDCRLPEGGRDEIGELTRSFNRMVERLRETRILEEKLRKAEHLSSVGQLASGIAHEIRNPLNLISLTMDYIGRLLADPRPEEKGEVTRRLSIVRGEIVRLNGMVESFLTLGKLREPHLHPISLHELIDEVSLLASPLMQDRGVTLETAMPVGLRPLMADREQLKSCLLNIIVNAVQATPVGGSVRLEARLTSLPKEQVVLSVTDTGVGIALENLERIFEPYFTTKEGGIGLGLPLARGVAEAHGGTIEIQSVQGEGTTVAIVLPQGGRG